MTLQAAPAALDRASARVGAVRDDIIDGHAVLTRQVDALLDAGWTGRAAEQFRGAWAQWCEGMSDVLAGLGVESAAIASTRAGLTGTDDERAAAVRLLQARLGER